MTHGSEQRSLFLALRVKGDGAAPAEIFMASANGMTYKGLPVCRVADGESIATEIQADEIVDIFGPPTHYYYGSTDQCWLLNAGKFARFKAESGQLRSIDQSVAHPARGGWLAPLLRILPSAEHPASPRGGGMLTRHIEFS
jgi:hypothetical protein